MTKKERVNFKSILDEKVEKYFSFFNRDDYPDKPCVRRAVDNLQNTVFNLAEVMWNCGVITWEVCCEYWSKVGFVDDLNENCKFTNCEANINGVCKYTTREERIRDGKCNENIK